MTESNRKTGKLTLATEAALIIREEYMARAAAALMALSDEELRPRVRARLVENIGYKDGAEWPPYVPKPETMSREDMIEMLASEAGGYPPTFAIGEDDDDPLVDAARELRRAGWERNVAWTIKTMRLTGPAAERHRAVAGEAELAFLRRLIEEAWTLSEANLRLRALEIVGKLVGGSEGDKEFPYDPDELSRGELLDAIAGHIERLTWAQCRRASTAA